MSIEVRGIPIREFRMLFGFTFSQLLLYYNNSSGITLKDSTFNLVVESDVVMMIENVW
jgi:hypothetical protein